MPTMRKIGCLLLLLAGTIAARAASFNCKKAATLQEKAICASPELSKADDRMAVAYKAALASVPAFARPDLLDTQRAFVRAISLDCKQDSWVVKERGMEGCLLNNYRVWIDRLQHITIERGGITFLTRSVTMYSPPDPDDRTDGVVTASWPKALSESPQWLAWNKAVEQATQDMASSHEYGDKTPGAWLDSWAAGQESDITTTVDGLSSQLVAATVFGMIDGGGAHPNEYWVELNWLLKEERAARPEDIFRPDSGWENFLQARCIAALKNQFGDYYPDVLFDKTLTSMLKEIVNSGNWRINSNGLTMVFQQYAITSHADQVEPILIPWSALKPYLQPTFLLPEKL